MDDLIFGFTWEKIQRAQQGGKLHDTVDIQTNSKPVQLNPGDMELLEKHGIDGLTAMQFFGVIDRLTRNGTI